MDTANMLMTPVPCRTGIITRWVQQPEVEDTATMSMVTLVLVICLMGMTARWVQQASQLLELVLMPHKDMSIRVLVPRITELAKIRLDFLDLALCPKVQTPTPTINHLMFPCPDLQETLTLQAAPLVPRLVLLTIQTITNLVRPRILMA